MKKLLVLSVLLGLLTLPVFAEHATIDFGGDDTYGFMTDFGDGVLTTLDLTWDVIVGIDDYNSFTWSLTDIDQQGNIALDKALTTTDGDVAGPARRIAYQLGLRRSGCQRVR
jgi:hypothetical protein